MEGFLRGVEGRHLPPSVEPTDRWELGRKGLRGLSVFRGDWDIDNIGIWVSWVDPWYDGELTDLSTAPSGGEKVGFYIRQVVLECTM